MVSLKTFVKETLREVLDALSEFEEEELENGQDITPFPRLWSAKDNNEFLMASVAKDGQKSIHMIMPMEFDIAVTASSEDETSAGVGLRVVEMFKAGIDTKETVANSSVSRVRFKVPVQLARRD